RHRSNSSARIRAHGSSLLRVYHTEVSRAHRLGGRDERAYRTAAAPRGIRRLRRRWPFPALLPLRQVGLIRLRRVVAQRQARHLVLQRAPAASAIHVSFTGFRNNADRARDARLLASKQGTLIMGTDLAINNRNNLPANIEDEADALLASTQTHEK